MSHNAKIGRDKKVIELKWWKTCEIQAGIKLSSAIPYRFVFFFFRLEHDKSICQPTFPMCETFLIKSSRRKKKNEWMFPLLSSWLLYQETNINHFSMASHFTRMSLSPKMAPNGQNRFPIRIYLTEVGSGKCFDVLLVEILGKQIKYKCVST